MTSPMWIQVAVPAPSSLGLLTYAVPSALAPFVHVGHQVVVPLGKRRVIGVVTGLEASKPPSDQPIKDILDIVPGALPLTTEQLALCHFVSSYYCSSLYEAIRLCLPPDTHKNLAAGWRLTEHGKLYVRKNEAEDSINTLLRLFPPRAMMTNKELAKQGIKKKQIEQLDALGYIEQAFTAPKKKRSTAAPTDESEQLLDAALTLTQEQDSAITAILNGTSKSGAFLLEGITGSGKTEVYLRVAKAMLEAEKSVLFIVPEIALTPQMHDRFVRALGNKVVMLHSGLTDASRRDALLSLHSGTCLAVIGARSALFAPMPNLGLIVVDEEHDPSYKQGDSPRYHARDVALWRAHHNHAIIILGSATPSLESRINTQRGKLTHIALTKRASNAAELPTVQVVDLRARGQHHTTKERDSAQSEGASHPILSGPLQEAIRNTLQQGEQAMVFLNRRGYSAFMLCDACGTICQCPNCSVSLTLHQRAGILRCHQCDHLEAVAAQCVACGFGPMLKLGTGTERVEEELLVAFPNANIARLDRDVAKSFRSVQNILQRMQDKRIDILVGTQMIAKGHDFPHVSLVGVVLADVALSMPDFRASERTFQLLTQVAGRAGRREKKGHVIIQTYNPAHPAIVFACQHDAKGFSQAEMQTRLETKQPPFSKATLLRLEGEDGRHTETAAMQCGQLLHKLCLPHGAQHASLLGPAPAPLERLRNRFRHHLLLRTTSHHTRQSILQTLLRHEDFWGNLRKLKVKLVIDVDPVHLM